jgi:RhtB (resistance to homoserine/threonine) family protein
MGAEILPFVGVAAILAITPGPDMALVARNALVAGRSAVPVTVTGICAGIVIHFMAAAVGLSALLKASSEAYAIVKILGGAYLVYLGVQAWRASMSEHGDQEWMLGPARRFAGGSAFRQGFISNVLNPKLVVFFISVMPQFTSPDHPFFVQVLVLGVAFELLTIAWLMSYGLFVARVGEAMRHPRVRRLLERVSGTVLIALGLKVATTSSSSS